jgi:hypothetical protein
LQANDPDPESSGVGLHGQRAEQTPALGRLVVSPMLKGLSAAHGGARYRADYWAGAVTWVVTVFNIAAIAMVVGAVVYAVCRLERSLKMWNLLMREVDKQIREQLK